MAEIMKAGTPSVSSALTLPGNRINGLLAGEDIAAGDACHVGSDGQAYRSIGTVADAAADVRGFAAGQARSGEAVTLAFDVTMHYGADLTPSDTLYLSGTV